MPLVLASSLSIAALLFGAQLMLRPVRFLRTARMAFIILLVGKLILASYFTFQQYFIWLSHPLTKILLPPYQGWQYFTAYSLTNFYLIPATTALMALLVLFVIKAANRKFDGRFFEPVESYLAGIAILLTGNPVWIYYLAAVLTCAFLLSTFYLLLSRNRERRISLYYFWLPIAVFVILIRMVV